MPSSSATGAFTVLLWSARPGDTDEVENEGYLVPAQEATAELRERGSRFIAVVAPATDESEAHQRIDEARGRWPDATHVCWAWRLGAPARERSADAGEPAGTAGPPMLQVLRGGGFSDTVVLVARWFGGTKLGKGGLARAYSGAARLAVERTRWIERVPRCDLRLELSYPQVGGVKRLVHPPQIELGAEHYGEQVELVLSVAVSQLEELVAALADLGITPMSD